MATANQHPNVCYVTAPMGQPYVVIQTQQPQSQVPQRLYLRKTHKVLGILQMIAGCLCFSMEVIGVCIGPTDSIGYTGFYTGVFFIIAGLLGYLAFKRNNNCFLVACMVMSILAAVICSVGISMSVMEMKALAPSIRSRSKRLLQNVKESVIMAACVFEFFVCIIHASCTCASCCECCWPRARRPLPVSRAVPATVIVQQPGQMDAQPSAAFVIQQGNTPAVLSTKPPSYPESGQQNEAFGASSVSPPPYQE